MQTSTVTMVMHPTDKNAEMLERYKALMAPGKAAFEIVAQRGHGSYLWDVDGERYLDFTSGNAVNNVGHGHPSVVMALRKQIEQLIHTSWVTYNATAIELAEKLAMIAPTGLDSVFMCSTAGEAMEAALKFARFATGRPNVLWAGACHLDLDSLSAGNANPESRTVAAIVVEPVGEDGYLTGLRQFCDEAGILLVFDEVETGFGRTGRWFAANHSGVTPDAMVVANGMASGFPMAAFMTRKELMDKWSPDRESNTFGGNPVACAAALASIRVIENENLRENARKMGERIMARMKLLKEKFECIGDVLGTGLMISVELGDERVVKVIEECFARKLMLLAGGIYGNAVRFLPPLTCTQNEVEDALDIFEEVLSLVQ